MGSQAGTGPRGGQWDGELRSRPIAVLLVHLLAWRVAVAEDSTLRPMAFDYGEDWQGKISS